MRLLPLPGTFSVILLFTESHKWIPGSDFSNFSALKHYMGAPQGVKPPEPLCLPPLHVTKIWLSHLVFYVVWQTQ